METKKIKTMKKSVYRKAAEYLMSHKADDFSGMCDAIEYVDSKHHNRDLMFYFKPSEEDRKLYDMGRLWWGRDRNLTPEKNRDYRCLALLLMEQIENDKKLRR